MDYIYIDTSIFEANNFLESHRINEIFKLAEEKELGIVLPAITYNEVKSRAIKNIKEASNKFRSYRDSTRVLRNIGSLTSKFEKFDEEKCIEEFTNYFNFRLEKSHAQVIDYPTLNIKEVFDKYFAEDFPFSKGEKKNEFPDAFALLSIEHWCKKTKNKCYVFSHDKDLLNYQSEYLIIVASYEGYLDTLLRLLESEKQRQGRIEKLNETYKICKRKLELEIAKWLFIQLSKPDLYQKFNDINVFDIIVNDTDAKLKELQIISADNTEILVETKAEVSYNVEVEVEDNYLEFSKERYPYGADTMYVLYESKKVIPIQMKISNPIDNIDHVWFTIDLINNGKPFVL